MHYAFSRHYSTTAWILRLPSDENFQLNPNDFSNYKRPVTANVKIIRNTNPSQPFG